MSYNWSFPFIKKDLVKVAFEIGSWNLLDALQIQKYFDCKIYSFECDPGSIQECRKNNNGEIILVEKAVSQTDGSIPFFLLTKISILIQVHRLYSKLIS